MHFSHFSAQKSIFCPKSDFGRQSAIWELREPPAGSRDRPRREPRGGVPGDPSESGPGEKRFENKAEFSKSHRDIVAYRDKTGAEAGAEARAEAEAEINANRGMAQNALKTKPNSKKAPSL